MSKKQVKCPFCTKRYIEKKYLYSHMEKEHYEQLDGLSPANVVFNNKYKKSSGKCIMCKRETPFNEETERYDRLCSTRCSDRYREQFRQRMQKKYNKDHLLDDPNQQKLMQQGRRISGKYTWSDGTSKDYMGTYELDALKFLDKELNMESKDVIIPSPITIPYTYNGNDHFYMPDMYIVPYHLLIEVKGSNNHYQKRDRNVELTKDNAAIASEYNYVKILDKNYKPLLSIIDVIKNT